VRLEEIAYLSQDEVRRLRRRATWLCSHPKCGRTWLRFLLGSYMNRALALGVDLNLRNVFRLIPNDAVHIDRFKAMGNGRKAHAFALADLPGAPVVLGTHSRCKPMLLKRPVILLTRSIPDTLVSHHIHQREGAVDVPERIADHLRTDPSPIDRLIDFYNGWAEGLDASAEPSLLVSYERLTMDAARVVTEVAAFVGLPPDAGIAAAAADDASFESMRRLELAHGAEWRDAGPGQVRTRVRRGRVGGSREDLSPDDLAIITDRCRSGLTPGAVRLLARAGTDPIPAHPTPPETHADPAR